MTPCNQPGCRNLVAQPSKRGRGRPRLYCGTPECIRRNQSTRKAKSRENERSILEPRDNERWDPTAKRWVSASDLLGRSRKSTGVLGVWDDKGVVPGLDTLWRLGAADAVDRLLKRAGDRIPQAALAPGRTFLRRHERAEAPRARSSLTAGGTYTIERTGASSWSAKVEQENRRIGDLGQLWIDGDHEAVRKALTKAHGERGAELLLQSGHESQRRPEAPYYAFLRAGARGAS
jgi:hypothetical protein